ncbi:MAG: hypothetical protein CR974_00535 [Gammaproteobacteria bacterium]|nr:MAG: hypothetical protein CR974_00535 [Gammaproteobacteria bacterium]
MKTLPKRQETRLFSVADIRAGEQALFETQDSYAVMQAAAQAVTEVIVEDFPTPQANQCVHIMVGAGNNAGDGLLVAAQLLDWGFAVKVYRLFSQAFCGDALKAYQHAEAAGVAMHALETFAPQPNDILVEAIFGIGLDRPITGVAKTAIEHINAYKAAHPSVRIYAIDTPAGILSDTGAATGTALIADKTVTFIADKIGLHTAAGKGCAGQVIVNSLGWEAPAERASVFAYRYDAPVGNFRDNSHKGDYGHALIVGGGRGMFGATVLAAVSALKVGVGKSSIYAHHDYASQFHLGATPLYEVMRKADLNDLAEYTCVVLGVGLGRDDWGEKHFMSTVAQCHGEAQKLLIDADGLWHLATADIAADISVITPHEAEAARLLHCDIAAVRQDKIHAVRALAKRYHCVAVLKGAGTLISDGQTVWVNSTGNCCLASAGTGDVLAGMIGGYLAQGLSTLDAARYGVFRHGLAAEHYLAAHGDKTLRASDLWQYIAAPRASSQSKPAK